MKMNTPIPPLNIEKIRQDFPLLQNEINGKSLAYLDNAATTQKPKVVLEKLHEFYTEYNANVHRAIYSIGERATEEYEKARQKVANFIHAPDPHSVIFTRGATEAINLIAYAWGRYHLHEGDEILITEMEHHSNIIPWQLATRDTGTILRYIPIHHPVDGTLDLNMLESCLTERTKLVAVIHQSNVFGTINPVKEIIDAAHSVNALVLIDGAQSVPHMKVDVQELDCDFLAFSGHKMMGPSGVGILYAKHDLLDIMEPFMGGGEMISSVSMEHATWNEVPWKFEAGTPNIAQAIGLGAAIDYLSALNIERVNVYEKELTDYALNLLGNLPDVTIYGYAPHRGAIISFNVDGIHPHDLAQVLDQEGVAVRAGHHCAQPLMESMNVTATTRASFYVYNTKEEITRLCKGIEKAKSFLTGEK